MEQAAKMRPYIIGLDACIKYDAGLSAQDNKKWQIVKARGKRLFIPTSGGSWKKLTEWPLSREMVGYCAGDVFYMPRLWREYLDGMYDDQ